jgi:chromosome segregation ATPase
MGRNKDKESELIAAATELDAELTRFHEGVAAFAQLPLSSKKHLDRATAALNALADSEAKLGTHVQALVQAVAATREGQAAQLDTIRAKAESLKSRSVEFQQLIAQFESLGQGAGSLNAKLQAGGGAELPEIVEEVNALAARAGALNTQAREKDFEDVAHMADGLRQQLESLAGKLKSGPSKSIPSA